MTREVHRCPECSALHTIGGGDKGEISLRIIELRQRHPEWPPSVIADKIGSNRSFTTETLQRAGLPTKAVYDGE